MESRLFCLCFASFLVSVVSDSTRTPSQIHLAYGGSDPGTKSPTGMTVAWFTQDLTAPSVRYGVSPSMLSLVAGEERVTQYMKDRGYHYSAFIDCSDIMGSGKVYYQVGATSGTGTVWSNVYSFKTVGWSSTDSMTRIALFGDMGYKGSKERPMVVSGISSLAKNWSAVYTYDSLLRMKENDLVDFFWHVGDVGYVDDSFAHDPLYFSYEPIYNKYMDWIQNYTAETAYMVTPGNHESECHSPACVAHPDEYGHPLSNFTAFNSRWHMPSAESGGRANMWYSFNYGAAHLVSMNTETDFEGAGEEKTGDSGLLWLKAGSFGAPGEYQAWLEADLAAADKARKTGSPDARPWLVVSGHRPFSDIGFALPLFEKYGVDAYFGGHVHSYCRSTPLAAASASKGGVEVTTLGGSSFAADHYTNFKGTMFITTGGAGCEEQGYGTSAGDTRGTATGDKYPDGCAANSTFITNDDYTIGRLSYNSSHLVWELVDSSDNTRVIDGFVLTK